MYGHTLAGLQLLACVLLGLNSCDAFNGLELSNKLSFRFEGLLFPCIMLPEWLIDHDFEVLATTTHHTGDSSPGEGFQRWEVLLEQGFTCLEALALSRTATGICCVL